MINFLRDLFYNRERTLLKHIRDSIISNEIFEYDEYTGCRLWYDNHTLLVEEIEHVLNIKK